MKNLVKYRDRLESKRTERLYVRVSTEEKKEIISRAHLAGFQSVGAFLVHLALSGA